MLLSENIDASCSLNSTETCRSPSKVSLMQISTLKSNLSFWKLIFLLFFLEQVLVLFVFFFWSVGVGAFNPSRCFPLYHNSMIFSETLGKDSEEPFANSVLT